jgi:hypothetical protein
MKNCTPETVVHLVPVDKKVAGEDQQSEDPQGSPIAFTSCKKIRSRRYFDIWDFTGTEATGNGKKAVVSFKKTEVAHKKAIQDVLADLYDSIEIRTGITPTAIQLDSWRYGLEWAAKLIDSTDWKILNNRPGQRSFKARLKKTGLGAGVIEEITTALNKLFEQELTTYMPDGRALNKLAKPNRVEQAIAIPVAMYSRLLQRAIETIEIYHPYRQDISKTIAECYEIDKRIMSGENTLAEQSGRRPATTALSMSKSAIYSKCLKARQMTIKHKIPNFEPVGVAEWLSTLQASCALVITAFSGARIGEVVSFERDAYTTVPSDDSQQIPVLKGETTKGEDGKPKQAIWQTHAIAKDVLELAYGMTESTREQYKAEVELMYERKDITVDAYKKACKELAGVFIPTKPSTQSTMYTAGHFSRRFANLMKSYDIKATKEDVEEFNRLNPNRVGQLKLGGYLPKLSPHDMRRTFAVFYKRYNFGSMMGIKFQYKHKNLNMSEYYANQALLMSMEDILLDKDLLKEINESGVDLGIDIYDDIFNQSAVLGGIEGARQAQEKLERVKQGHAVLMDRDEIGVLITNGTLAAVQLPTGGYCTNMNCDRICGLSLFIAEKKDCPHKITTDETAKVSAKERNRLIKQFRGLNTGDSLLSSILVGIKQKIKEIEVTLQRHGIKHEAFEDKIEGVLYVSN